MQIIYSSLVEYMQELAQQIYFRNLDKTNLNYEENIEKNLLQKLT